MPPSVNAGRMIAGKPTVSRNDRACSSELTVRARGMPQPDRMHDLPERVAVFRTVDHLPGSADHLHAESRERALVVELAGAVECGLTAQGRKHRVDRSFPIALLLQDLLDRGSA